MYKLHYDHIENKYGNNSRRLFTGADSLMYEMLIKILVKVKKCLILVIKDEAAGVAIG